MNLKRDEAARGELSISPIVVSKEIIGSTTLREFLWPSQRDDLQIQQEREWANTNPSMLLHRQTSMHGSDLGVSTAEKKNTNTNNPTTGNKYKRLLRSPKTIKKKKKNYLQSHSEEREEKPTSRVRWRSHPCHPYLKGAEVTANSAQEKIHYLRKRKLQREKTVWDWIETN